MKQRRKYYSVITILFKVELLKMKFLADLKFTHVLKNTEISTSVIDSCKKQKATSSINPTQKYHLL